MCLLLLTCKYLQDEKEKNDGVYNAGTATCIRSGGRIDI